VDKVGLWKNTLSYLGFIEDDLEEDFASYRDHSQPRIIPPDALNYEARAPQPLASVHPLPVRQTAPQPEVPVIWPKSYSDVQRIGDSLRASVPVIVNLEATDGDFSKRVIAFACGLVYGLDGSLKKLGRGVYLLSPATVETASARRQHFGREGLGS
jgi:FtsZ-interacting cell division protein YlmF